jgi:hypothetical protein
MDKAYADLDCAQYILGEMLQISKVSPANDGLVMNHFKPSVDQWVTRQFNQGNL